MISYTGTYAGGALGSGVPDFSADGNLGLGLPHPQLIQAALFYKADDILDGGDGDDQFVGDSADLPDSAQGDDELYGEAGTLGDNFENLTLLGATNLNGTGNAADNFIQGNNADNALYGLDSSLSQRADSFERLHGGEDGNALVATKIKQVFVAGNDDICLRSESTGQNLIIVWIADHNRHNGNRFDHLRQGQITGDQLLRGTSGLRYSLRELAPCQNLLKLCEQGGAGIKHHTLFTRYGEDLRGLTAPQQAPRPQHWYQRRGALRARRSARAAAISAAISSSVSAGACACSRSIVSNSPCTRGSRMAWRSSAASISDCSSPARCACCATSSGNVRVT